MCVNCALHCAQQGLHTRFRFITFRVAFALGGPAPCRPAAPVGPWNPGSPVVPLWPFQPIGPFFPLAPLCPAGPRIPFRPGLPGGPSGLLRPGGPGGPSLPFVPGAPAYKVHAVSVHVPPQGCKRLPLLHHIQPTAENSTLDTRPRMSTFSRAPKDDRNIRIDDTAPGRPREPGGPGKPRGPVAP